VPGVSFEALGTTCHLFGIGPAARRLDWGAGRVFDLGRRLTRFEPDSELSRLNAGAGEWTPVGPELEALLREALRAWEVSGGLVNAACLGAMRAIGYTQPLREGLTMTLDPAPGPLAPLPEVLEVEPGRARLAPGAGVDLGGLAKGWMADRLVEGLGDNALANIGGDLAARGDGPAGEGWAVGFAGESVALRDGAAATSALRRRRWGGVHHVIDPRTGRPAETDLAEVQVLARTGVEAEVLAKTGLLLGSERAPEFLSGHALGWALYQLDAAYGR
jgi:thiamine biosynthesis lipoprotein